MAYKEVLRVEIAEVVRRRQTGESHGRIAESTGLAGTRWPSTYRQWRR